MKRIILILTAILLVGCCKEEEPKPCNCGTITNVEFINKSPYGYIMDVQNECSGEILKFKLGIDSAYLVNLGGRYCIGQGNRW